MKMETARCCRSCVLFPAWWCSLLEEENGVAMMVRGGEGGAVVLQEMVVFWFALGGCGNGARDLWWNSGELTVEGDAMAEARGITHGLLQIGGRKRGVVVRRRLCGGWKGN